MAFGAALRRAREERGVSLDEIAAETRLSKRYLLALEDEAISKLPGGTYNRAYLRTYATFLALDPESLLRDYAQEESRQTQLAEADQLAAMTRAIEKRAAVGAGATRAREVIATPAGIAAVAVLAFAVVGGVVWFGLSGFSRASSDLEVASTESTTAPMPPPVDSVVPRAAAPVPKDTSPAPARTPAAAPAAASVTAPPADTPAATLPPPAASPPAGVTPTSSATPERATAAPQVRPPSNAGHDIVRVADARGLSRLTVAGSGVGTGVVERQLVGEADRFAVGSKVVFWTHVRGGKAGDTIDHVWFRDGTLVGAASLAVGSPDWRTQSRRLLDPSGVWVVEARDADGHVLARHEFQAGAP